MREENPFTLHVCTDCIGRLETKIVLLLSGASEKRGMMRTCCPTEEGENPCSEAMDGQLPPEQGQKQRSIEDLQKGVFQALLSSILQGNPCRWLLGPSPSIPHPMSLSHLHHFQQLSSAMTRGVTTSISDSGEI